MKSLHPETRRLIELSRRGDDPAPGSDARVQSRLMSRLGKAAFAGAAGASIAAGAADAIGAASSSAAGSTAAGAAGSAALQTAAAGVTGATLVKTVATLLVVTGPAVGAWENADVREHAWEWSAEMSARVERVVERVWGAPLDHIRETGPDLPPPVIGTKVLHERLIAIARRPHRPIAKEAELLLILGAEEALASGDRVLAEQYLDRHHTLFPGGELASDREALREICKLAPGSPNF
jgi:hypothetical protein